MQVGSYDRCIERRQPLRHEARHSPGQHIARARRRQGRGGKGIDAGMTIGCGDDRIGSLEHDHHIPLLCRTQGQRQPVLFDVGHGGAEQARHLARMGSQYSSLAQRLVPVLQLSQGIQPVGIDHQRRQA